MNTPRSRTALAAVLLAVLATLLPAPVQAQAVARYEDQARSITNNKRDNHDLRQLKRGACVQKWARRQAQKMADKNEMFHQDLGRVMNRCHLDSVGENVAAGYPTGRAAVKAWMKSPGHRANILRPGYRLLGMAVRTSGSGTKYACQVFGSK
ncbi:hypothetical protein GCM10009623_08260 [Nocardioides aestuarii]|uniref:CAP domain-containing protein n=1 Tax=Nocardioides aestuarii TaxID=252231 RepID=A0ABW4THW1_9ACTN